MNEYMKRLVEKRQNTWSQTTELLDRAAAEKRDLTAEENETYTRAMNDLDATKGQIDDLVAAERREAEIAEQMRGLESVVRPAAEARTASSERDILRSLLKGEVRSHMFDAERRDITTGTSNAPVPSTFAGAVIDQARLVGPMLDPNVVTVLNTTGGENFVFPTQSAWSTAAKFAEGTSIDESDPTFGKMTLSAYKYAFLVQVSREMVEDSSIDIMGFVAQQSGNAIGYAVNSKLTLGTGTVEPTGIVVAAGTGVTGSTAVTGAFTGDNLISLLYSVDGAARRLPGFGFMTSATNIAALRSLKASTSGEYLFTPTLDAATPDRLLGFPLIENPHVAGAGTGVKSVLAGHFPSYYVRQVGGIRVDSSSDYAFASDLVTIRATIRVDGNLGQQAHVKAFRGGTA